LKEHLDIMTVPGNGANIECLKKAGIKDTDILIAVSGDESANVLACQLASHMNIQNTVCRLDSVNFFSEEDNLNAKALNLHNIVIPAEECARKIFHVLSNKIVMEKILFSNQNAVMTAFEALPSSPITGARIKDISNTELMDTVRFAAILRDRKHITPHGDTIIVPGDKVYVAGRKSEVESVIKWNSPENSSISKVTIAGATRVGRNLTAKLYEAGYEVRIIEKDFAKGARLLDELKAGIMVINGDATDREVMIEAGVDSTDAFVSALDDDEDNILCAIMAKEMGARKVVTVTNKAEYANIIPAINMIDSGFSSSLVAVNTVLRQIQVKTETVSIEAILNRINACIFEFKVNKGSIVCNKRIDEIKFPLSTTLALVFRDNKVISATGALRFEEGDIATTVTSSDNVKALEPLFAKKGLLNL